MSPSFKCYSMTNKLPLSPPPLHARLTASWLPWWGGLPIATGGGMVLWDWQWRQLASDCLSVFPSPCVRLGLRTARCPSPQLKCSVRLLLVCLGVSVGLCFGSRTRGGSPHICWKDKCTAQWQIHNWTSWSSSLTRYLKNYPLSRLLWLRCFYTTVKETY